MTVASNFRIDVHRNSDNLHLKLVGDFDGALAHQLINALQKHGAGAFSIFIHTSNLKQVYAFGRDTFQKNLHGLDNRFSGNLIFTGEHATTIAPKNSQIL